MNPSRWDSIALFSSLMREDDLVRAAQAVREADTRFTASMERDPQVTRSRMRLH